jgi:heme-degrading monooxygenase HmoA
LLVKWIKCQVNESEKDSFSIAQQQWKSLENAEGFVGQLGGWELKNSCEAGILSIWKDTTSYRHFMESLHDRIVDNSEQQNTYTKISVELYEGLYNISLNHCMFDVLGEGNILRVAECRVKEENERYFEKMQQEVWNKDMLSAEGIVAGVCCKSQNDSKRYLVVSIWKDNHAHQNYVENQLPHLVKGSSVKELTENIFGNVIEIDHSWTVI